MTGGAILWCGFIENDCFRIDHSGELMTLRTRDPLMRAAQRERSTFLMVEERWLPLRAVVALGTASHFPYSELLRVYVLVTVFALRWSRLEVYVDEFGLKIWRFVTIDASGRPVRPKEGKLCFRVVESGEFLPRFSVVAGLASGS